MPGAAAPRENVERRDSADITERTTFCCRDMEDRSGGALGQHGRESQHRT